ncbi:LOW QUALITY PROTEIN: integral membrane protein [Geosmithia morbida]|uniref:Integral membrane protein n=1 Tax=Geosmithia morbida TaxID=1094350 RepID=A0A9P4YT34_9HYPO|nr:LOW QUALITY PROTEIN: uncharacterized protein GMORB2_2113 [Geosmithia morbida]KAF4121151.1 LOW QUALITY PROTEIN: integral membrane protein [Geosmithia morbida]
MKCRLRKMCREAAAVRAATASAHMSASRRLRVTTACSTATTAKRSLRRVCSRAGHVVCRVSGVSRAASRAGSTSLRGVRCHAPTTFRVKLSSEAWARMTARASDAFCAAKPTSLDSGPRLAIRGRDSMFWRARNDGDAADQSSIAAPGSRRTTETSDPTAARNWPSRKPSDGPARDRKRQQGVAVYPRPVVLGQEREGEVEREDDGRSRQGTVGGVLLEGEVGGRDDGPLQRAPQGPRQPSPPATVAVAVVVTGTSLALHAHQHARQDEQPAAGSHVPRPRRHGVARYPGGLVTAHASGGRVVDADDADGGAEPVVPQPDGPGRQELRRENTQVQRVGQVREEVGRRADDLLERSKVQRLSCEDAMANPNAPPSGYRTPRFPSLNVDNIHDTTPERVYSLYYISDIWVFTLAWHFIVYAVFHLAAVFITMYTHGWRMASWKYLWAVPVMNTWIPFIWSLVSLSILVISSFSMQGGL